MRFCWGILLQPGRCWLPPGSRQHLWTSCAACPAERQHLLWVAAARAASASRVWRRPPAILGASPLNPPARLCRNSEIYNHQQLREAKLAGVDLHSKSDSAVVGYLYQK